MQVDEIVIAQAEDDMAWEESIFVRRSIPSRADDDSRKSGWDSQD